MKALVAALLFASACAGTATYSATVTTPDLVEVEPGVQVIVDYDEPVFYSEGYYWRNSGGRWSRSTYHDRGWGYAEPPQRVVRIQQPERYRRYRPANYKPRERHDNRPAPRRDDKKDNRPAPRPDHDKDKDKDKDRRDNRPG